MKTSKIKTIIVYCINISVFILLIGCSQTVLVTRQGDQLSNENISYDQFTKLRSGKYFEMILKDSSVVPITLIRAGIDSIIIETGDEPVRKSLPTDSVRTLIYHQNDNGFNALIGGFAGLFIGGAGAKSMFDLNDNSSSISGFAMIITGTIGGAVIGYNLESTMEYQFPSLKKRKK